MIAMQHNRIISHPVSGTPRTPRRESRYNHARMDKRYQVFISSTYADLKEERRAVIQTVIELNCIPAGMELFPAADEEQLAFIKRVIDDCDYYLLIIGGRYGSVDESGISYTEQEYDYAVSHDLKVIALLHEDPWKIALENSEKEPVGREKLQRFRDKVSTGRLVKFWRNAAELPGLVSINLSRAMNVYPAVGWVRADSVANVEVLGEINEVRKQNALLQKQLAATEEELINLASPPALENLAGLDEEVKLGGRYWNEERGGYRDWDVTTTWRKIFAHVSPYLVSHPAAVAVKGILASTLFKDARVESPVPDEKVEKLVHFDDQDFQTVGVQLRALGLVEIKYTKTTSGGMGLFWSFTAAGERLMVELRAVRTKTPAAGDRSKS
jgi:hypothetical protein